MQWRFPSAPADAMAVLAIAFTILAVGLAWIGRRGGPLCLAILIAGCGEGFAPFPTAPCVPSTDTTVTYMPVETGPTGRANFQNPHYAIVSVDCPGEPPNQQ